MKVAALQQFLRNLAAPFSAIGVPQHSLGAVAACAEAFEPFKNQELSDLADFLRRADEARRSGVVPLVDVPAAVPVGALARKLGEDVQSVATAEGDSAKGLEQQINLHRHQFQAAITDLAQQFGITVKCTETANWVKLVRAKKIMTDLKALITGPESYQEPSAAEGVRQLTELDESSLKQLAAEYEVPTVRKKRPQIVEEILAKVTQHRPVGKKPAAPRATKASGADQTQVDEMIRTLREKVQQVKENPRALSDAEVDELIAELRSKKFKGPQQQAIAEAVTGSKGKNGADAVIRVRSALASVKQNLDSQNA